MPSTYPFLLIVAAALIVPANAGPKKTSGHASPKSCRILAINRGSAVFNARPLSSAAWPAGERLTDKTPLVLRRGIPNSIAAQ